MFFQKVILLVALIFGIVEEKIEKAPILTGDTDLEAQDSQETAITASFPILDTSTTTEEIEAATSTIYCSCVEYVRKLSPYQPPKVKRALDIPVNQFAPKIGGWALFSYEPDGHAAYIAEIGENYIEVLEFNKIPCKESRRRISIYDPFLRGYFYE